MKHAKINIIILIVLVALIAASVCFSPKTVYAINQPQKTNLESVDNQSNKIIIKWQQIDECDGYEIQYATDPDFNLNMQSIEISNNISQYELQNNLRPNTDYYFRIRVFDQDLDVKYSDWSDVECFSYQVQTTDISSLSITDEFVNIEWEDPENAVIHGYEIECSMDEKFSQIEQFITINDRAQTNMQLINTFIPMQPCYFRIRTFKIVEFETFYSNWSPTKTTTYYLSVPKNVSVNMVDDKYQVSWENIQQSDHVLQISNYENFETVLFETTVSESSYTINQELASGTTYYVRVCSCVRGIMSNWSNISSFITPMQSTSFVDIGIYDDFVNLMWEMVYNCSGYEIRYADNQDFVNCKTIEIKDSFSYSTQIKNDLAPGKSYYFSIRAYNENYGDKTYSSWSDVQKIKWEIDRTYIKNLTLDNNSVLVNWKQIYNCSGYQIQYGQDPEFMISETIDVKNIYTENTNISNLTPGVCYFRIRTIKTIEDVDYYSEWSNTKSINFKFTKTYFMNQYAENNIIQIVWKNTGAYSYELQYSQDETFATYKTATFSRRSSKEDRLIGSIDNTTLTPGTYYLRIRTNHKVNGKTYRSEWSNTKTVDYKLTKTYIKTLTFIDNRIDVNWKTIENCDGYQIEYSNNKSMTNPSHVDIPDCEFNTYAMGYQLAPGYYYVRIRTYRIVNNQVYYSDWSNIKDVTYGMSKTYITNQYVQKGKATVQWKQMNCDGYNIQIASDDSFSNAKSIMVKDGNINEYENIDIPSGISYIRIRTYREIGLYRYYSGWSNAKVVIKNDSAPYIQYAYSQYNNLYVEWNKQDTADGYELQCCVDQKFEENVDSVNITSSDIAQHVYRVKPNTYYLRIRSYQISNDEKTYSELSETYMVDFRFNVPMFTSVEIESSDIRLNWEINKGCHGYRIQYSKDPNFETDIKTAQIFNTNTVDYVLENLDSGVYYIKIQSYKIFDDMKYYSDWSNVYECVIQ